MFNIRTVKQNMSIQFHKSRKVDLNIVGVECNLLLNRSLLIILVKFEFSDKSLHYMKNYTEQSKPIFLGIFYFMAVGNNFFIYSVG